MAKRKRITITMPVLSAKCVLGHLNETPCHNPFRIGAVEKTKEKLKRYISNATKI